MSNTTPEVRADRNGKLVTRHVKVDSSSPSKSTIPAPVSPAPVAKPKKRRNYGEDLTTAQMSSSMKTLIAGTPTDTLGSSTTYSAYCNDAQLYSVLGLVDNPMEAANLLSLGISTPADIADFYGRELEEDIDRINAMQAALLVHRIPGEDLFTFMFWNGDISEQDGEDATQRYLDAAKIYSIPAYRKVPGLVSAVLEGRASANDVMKVNARNLGNIRSEEMRAIVTDLFEKCADKGTKYTYRDIDRAALAGQGHKHGQTYARLYHEYDFEAVKGISDIEVTEDAIECCKKDSLSESETVESLKYLHELYSKLASHRDRGEDDDLPEFSTEGLYSLHRAGVPLDFAVEQMIQNKANPLQIIGIHEGAYPATSSGWL